MATGGTGTATNTLRTILGGTPLIGDSLAVGNTTIENDTLSISSINANNAYVLSAFVSEAYINKLYLPEISVISLNADYARISRLSGVSLSFTGGYVSGLSSNNALIIGVRGTSLSYTGGNIIGLSGTVLNYATGTFSNTVSANVMQTNTISVSTANVSTLNVSTANISNMNVSLVTTSTVSANKLIVNSISAQYISSYTTVTHGLCAAYSTLVWLENVAMSTLSEQALELWSNSIYAQSISAGNIFVASMSATNISVTNVSATNLSSTNAVFNDVTVSNALRVSKAGFQLNLGGGMTLGSPPGAWINSYNTSHTAFQGEQQGTAYRDIYINPLGANVYLGQASTGTTIISNRLQIGGTAFSADVALGPGVLTVATSVLSDVTANNTISGEGVYIQAGFGSARPLWVADGASSNTYKYLGMGGGDATNPDFLVTLKSGTGMQIANLTGAAPDFTEQLAVLGRARLSNVQMGTASVLSFQAVSAYISYISVTSISAGNISVASLSVGTFNATSAAVTNLAVSGAYIEGGLGESFTAQTGNFGLMQAISARIRTIEEVKSWGAGVLSVVITNSTLPEGYAVMPGNAGLQFCLQFTSVPAPSGASVSTLWSFPIPFTALFGVQATTQASTLLTGATVSTGKLVIGPQSLGGVAIDSNYGVPTKTALHIMAYGII